MPGRSGSFRNAPPLSSVVPLPVAPVVESSPVVPSSVVLPSGPDVSDVPGLVVTPVVVPGTPGLAVTKTDALFGDVVGDGAAGPGDVLSYEITLSNPGDAPLTGVELTDSCTWNPHKMMGVPLTCSAVLVREKGLLYKHLNETADYLFQADEEELNPGTRSLQCGRRSDALKLWAAWQFHGDSGLDARMTRLLDLARYAANVIESDPSSAQRKVSIVRSRGSPSVVRPSSS